MSAEERLQALEQLVVASRSEVLQARTAAAQAEQLSTDAETRVLGARDEGVVDISAGESVNWKQFKFWFLGSAGAVNARLEHALIESEVMEEAAIVNSVLPVGDQLVDLELTCGRRRADNSW